jgi:hypothetical protein
VDFGLDRVEDLKEKLMMVIMMMMMMKRSMTMMMMIMLMVLTMMMMMLTSILLVVMMMMMPTRMMLMMMAMTMMIMMTITMMMMMMTMMLDWVEDLKAKVVDVPVGDLVVQAEAPQAQEITEVAESRYDVPRRRKVGAHDRQVEDRPEEPRLEAPSDQADERETTGRQFQQSAKVLHLLDVLVCRN